MPASKHKLWLFVLVAALCGLRLVHLAADTPTELTPPRAPGTWPESWSIGTYVDEGYKTLDARNRVLFGQPKWLAGDDYPGWVRTSPLTHWPYCAAFALFGPELASARGVTIVYFAALLLAFALALRRRYGPGLVALGLLLLGTQHTLFFFSRAALFEVPLALCLYGFLFLLARFERLSGPARTALFVASLAVATFGIKGSSPLYFAPVALGLLVASSAHDPRRLLVSGLLLAIPLGLCAWYFQPLLEKRVDIDLLDVPRRLASGTLMHATAPLVALGLTCAFHALWVAPRRYLGARGGTHDPLEADRIRAGRVALPPNSQRLRVVSAPCRHGFARPRTGREFHHGLLGDPYRAGLIALVLLGPLCVSPFLNRPLRYYVPLMPAYVLLAVEWVHLRTWRCAPPLRTPRLALPALLALLTWALYCAGVAFHRHVLEPLAPGWSPLYGVPRAGIAAALLLAGGGLWFSRRLAARALPVAVLALFALSSWRDASAIGGFLAGPSYQAREIARALEAELPPGSSVAGDWAPFLTLGTSMRAIYSNPWINQAGRFSELRPDYYVFGGGYPWEHYGLQDPRDQIEMRGWLRRPALIESEYAGRAVLVYRLQYPALPE